jgi:hypothetical protein
LAGLKNGIKTVFSFGNIQRAAADCGFYRRSSKLLPDVFIDLLLKAAGTNGPISLSQLSSEAMSRHGISISKQAIDDRFDDKAVKFVKELLGQAIAAQVAPAADVDFLSKFNRVLVKDATRFDLPDRLKGDFAGFGGKVTSEAGMAIQYEYDLKDGKLHALDFTSATRNDLRDAAETQGKACKGDLVLRDLGYFSSPVLAGFDNAGAYYLSRLKSKMEVLLDTGQTLSFTDLYEEMSRKSQYRKHLSVTIGAKRVLKVRLVVETVPEHVYAERIRKREAQNKKKGQTMSHEFKARARFNLFVTNVPEKDLPADRVHDLYKMRWQIELLFKSWKSTLGVGKIHPMRNDRLLCLLYAKLMLYLAATQITQMFARFYYSRHDRLLSANKCIKTLMHLFAIDRSALTMQVRNLFGHTQKIAGLFSRNHWLEAKKGKVGFFDLLKLFTCMSDN